MGIVNRIAGLVVLFLAILFMPADGAAQDYLLGEGDLLKITVYANDDLTTVARVNAQGRISFPLVGEVDLSGKTVSQAEQQITSMLADGFIINPHVSVLIDEYRSKKMTILGEVGKPGLYELNQSVTLLEIISKAGGLTENAGDSILIKRKLPGQDAESGDDNGEYISVSRKKLMEEGDLSVNISVIDGDSIFVTRSGFVYVLGEVQKPGAYNVEKGATVMKAIALAGGLTDKAAAGRTVLIRKDGEKEDVFRVQMNFALMPDDIISVPESFF